MTDLFRDLRHALRTLRRHPGFAATAVLTLGIGIGATTAVFSLVDGIVLEPLPYPAAERLAVVRHAAPGLEISDAGVSRGIYRHYRDGSRVFEAVALYNENVVDLSGDGGPERVHVALATPAFFSVLGARPAHGRLFTVADGDAEPSPVVISHALWERRYGSDPGIVGRTIELNRAPKRVVGVLEPGFAFPRPETEVWYAYPPVRAGADVAGLYFSMIGRLRPGFTAEDAARDLNRLIPSLAYAYPEAGPPLVAEGRLHAVVEPLEHAVVGDLGETLWMLLAGVGLVLLIACANIGNLFLVRAEHRRRELAVRVALGAGPGDLARHFLGESALVAGLGGAVGIAIAHAGVRALVAFGPANVPRLHEVGVDARVLGFAAVLSLLTALLFGAAPALRHARPAVAGMLKDGGRGATGGRERQRTRALLVAVQVALALTLLVGSGLMARSFWRLQQVDPGFDADGVLTLEISLPYFPYPDFEARAGFWHGLLGRIRALPGVEAAGAVTVLPLSDNALAPFFRARVGFDRASAGAGVDASTVEFRMVTAGYFEAMRIPLVDGRAPRGGDAGAAVEPVLVSAPFARRFFADGNAIGQRVRRADDDGPAAGWNTIVGVAGGVRETSLRHIRAATLYVPVLDRPIEGWYGPSHMSVAVRAALPPISLAPAIRRIVREIDPELPIANVRPMERIVAGSMAHISFTMLLLLIAAGGALLLGALGVYAVISYAVSRRTHEIAIRLALGGHAPDVRRLLVRQSARAVLVGLAAGAAIALVLTRWLRSLLFEVSPTDPATFIAVALLLAAVAIFAGYLPARRATRIDPMTILRDD